MSYLKLHFTPVEDKRNGLVIYSKKLITKTEKGIATTDIKCGQVYYELPKGIRNNYKVYIK